MIAEGKIVIDLATNPDGGSLDVCISSNRISNIGKVFKARTPEEALAMLPMLFSLCGKAHLCAANNVIRSYGLETSVPDHAGQLAVLAENAREHLLRVILGWSRDNPETIAQLPVKQVMSLVADMDRAVNSSELKAVAEFANRLESLLKGHILGCEAEQWLRMESPGDLETWITSTDTITSRYLGDICGKGWQSVGAAPVDFLPQLSMAQLRQKMHNKEEGHFLSQPNWQGTTYETGPLARWHDHPLVASVIEEYDTGLLARNIARLVELAGLPLAIKVLAKEGSAEQTCEPDQVSGISAVETARGRLVHSLKMRDGLIDDYRILAPTEWNFHPAGSVAKSLQSLKDKDDNELKQRAEMLVAAIDPCVDFELRIV